MAFEVTLNFQRYPAAINGECWRFFFAVRIRRVRKQQKSAPELSAKREHRHGVRLLSHTKKMKTAWRLQKIPRGFERKLSSGQIEREFSVLIDNQS